MNNQKGFINIFVLIVVLVLIGIGGYYFIIRQPSVAPTTTTETPQNSSQTTPSNQEQNEVTQQHVPTETKQKTTEIPEQTIETPKQTAEKTFTLKSEYFYNDSTAQAIASGRVTNYDIRTFSSVYGMRGTYKTDSFAYKFLSGLRMLGYIRGNRPISGSDYVAELYLNRAQRFNNLALSPFVDISILKIVDSALAEKENSDREIASDFPLYNHLIASPLNEPAKDHLAALLVTTFKELPSHLVVWNEKNFKDFYFKIGPLGSLNDAIKNNDSPDYQICDNAYYLEFGQKCATATNFDGTLLINKVRDIDPSYDDFSYASMMLHEYAHYLDRRALGQEAGTSQGLIDTTGFYNISFDVLDPAPGHPDQFSYKRPQNIQNEFVSYNAQGSWKYTYPGSDKEYSEAAEDFAESFLMYVGEGKVFRKLAESNNILRQKYDWLKVNVFNGQEYQSGDIQSISVLRQQPGSYDATIQSTGAPQVIDYSTSLPNFVWNYKFLNGSLVSKP